MTLSLGSSISRLPELSPELTPPATKLPYSTSEKIALAVLGIFAILGVASPLGFIALPFVGAAMVSTFIISIVGAMAFSLCVTGPLLGTVMGLHGANERTFLAQSKINFYENLIKSNQLKTTDLSKVHYLLAYSYSDINEDLKKEHLLKSAILGYDNAISWLGGYGDLKVTYNLIQEANAGNQEAIQNLQNNYPEAWKEYTGKPV
jgi:hypothetical protein